MSSKKKKKKLSVEENVQCPFKSGDLVQYLEWDRVTQTRDVLTTFIALYPIPEKCHHGYELWEVKYLDPEFDPEVNNTWFAWHSFISDVTVLSHGNQSRE